MAYVYKHITKDTNIIFYIGIGSDKKYKRANSKYKRNKYWHNIVNKHGYVIEIVKDGLSWEEACKIEIELISKYGRKDLGKGFLVNMTEGGDGIVGLIMTEEIKEKRRLSYVRGENNPRYGTKHSKETLQKMKDATKTRDNTVYSRKKSKEEKEKMSISKLGNKNSRYGIKMDEKDKEFRRQLILKQPSKVCPYCKKEGRGPTMIKHHFNNCKNKKNDLPDSMSVHSRK
jgi:hypothetical protein